MMVLALSVVDQMALFHTVIIKNPPSYSSATPQNQELSSGWIYVSQRLTVGNCKAKNV